MISKTVMRTIFMVCAASTLFFSQAYSQEGELTEFLKAKDDANKLIGAYVSPVVEGLSYGLNGGWYHTAKAHKTLGIDLGVSVNAVFIPNSKNYFDPSALGLNTIETVQPNAKASTFIGPSGKTEYRLKANPTTTFKGPEGIDMKGSIGMNAVPAPVAQIGIGIWKNTDIKFRYMPEIEFSETKVKMIGFGVMHDVKQHIRAIKLLPFDLSVVAGFTRLSGSTGLEGTFAKPANDQRPQEMTYQMNAWLIQALISKKLSVVTFYGGIGYNTISTKVDMLGSYVVPEAGSTALKDPFGAKYKNNSFRATVGMRLKLGPIYLNGDYSLQEYSTLSVGLGVSVR
jgi:hypothetical protein